MLICAAAVCQGAGWGGLLFSIQWIADYWIRENNRNYPMELWDHPDYAWDLRQVELQLHSKAIRLGPWLDSSSDPAGSCKSKPEPWVSESAVQTQERGLALSSGYIAVQTYALWPELEPLGIVGICSGLLLVQHTFLITKVGSCSSGLYNNLWLHIAIYLVLPVYQQLNYPYACKPKLFGSVVM